MSDTTLPSRDRVPVRRRDANATRAAILVAAIGLFAHLGYDKTSLREIATEAGADVALIKRYFGGKEALFTEALKASFPPDWVRDWNRRSFATEMAQMMADGVPVEESRTHSVQFLLRAATSPTTAPLLNAAMQERFLHPIRDWLGDNDAQARARVLAAALIGLVVERLIRDEPLRGQEREVFVDRVTQMFEALVSKAPRARRARAAASTKTAP